MTPAQITTMARNLADPANAKKDPAEERDRRDFIAGWLIRNLHGRCNAWLNTIADADFRADMKARLISQNEKRAQRQRENTA